MWWAGFFVGLGIGAVVGLAAFLLFFFCIAVTRR